MSQIGFPAIRWAARSAALVVAGGFFLLVWGEIASPHSGPPTQLREYAGIALLTIAIFGALSAWKWELPGALLSLVTLTLWTYLVHMHRWGVVVVIAVPGVLFVADWFLRRERSKRARPFQV
jgi:hypothetical protein